ncbi:MAG TPA: chemotaxis protein, partial [Sphingomicrobium sp.]|nr:chemotaxis protein [Sphingomicrobium sp.]
MASGGNQDRSKQAGGYDLARGLRFYDRGGELAARAAGLWPHIENVAMDVNRGFWTVYRSCRELTSPITDGQVEDHARKALPYTRSKFLHLDSYDWVDSARAYVIGANEAGVSLTSLLAAMAAGTEAAVDALYQVEDQVLRRELGRTLREVAALETDVWVHHCVNIAREASEKSQSEHASDFNRKVMGVVGRCSSDSDHLRAQASTTASAARGMLGKTSEVAAAAEQSAVAMREAAQTAAGLIRAIEDARTEVETAADVATKAGSQAAEAVKVSQALSSHVEAIESILSLIRDIAGQTNLLA